VETALRCPPALAGRIDAVRTALAELGAPSPSLALAAEAAGIVGAITDDEVLALGTFAHALRSPHDALDAPLAHAVGEPAIAVARALDEFGDIGLPRDWSPAQGLDARQAETLRKMLLAMTGDARLVVARLALQLARLRAVRTAGADARQRAATETREIFAPLANRLGIWQLKWELEDLAFRLLEADEYRRIAGALAEKRGARESYIERFCAAVSAALAASGITAEVYGRPKHIYSIYRKMQRKHLAFEQIYDVRAVRVLCESIADCYAALGIVHGAWAYVPGEFDDYIATPKDNLYRSIHTAVAGPDDRIVEVQIRTREMHEHAELGVAAHWRYKEGGVRDAGYDRKIEAVRRLVTPEPGDAADGDFIDRVRATLFGDRVYALTPKGEVVDLPQHATPLDFAYHVHSDLGHRCRGAKVNGRIVPLTHRLANGDVVEVITGKALAPSRDWMAPEQGYLVSPRNRARVRAWFRRQGETENRAAGRAMLERELARAGGGTEHLAALVQELRAPDANTLYRHLGEGETTMTQLTQALGRLIAPRARPPRVPATRQRPASRQSPVAIEGVGDLPITLARCCAPVRPQAIVGYVTVGRGVTVHRSDCPHLARMRREHPERALECAWIEGGTGTQRVELTIVAIDRRALVRDLSDVVASERLQLEALTTTTQRREGTATTVLRIGVRDLADLTRLTARLAAIANVLGVRRTG
jgi:GTP pyrophosphokinase